MSSAVVGSDAHRKSVKPMQAHQIAQDPEIRIGHQLPHQARPSAGAVISGSSSRIEARLLKRVGFDQQQRDAEAEQQLDADGQDGIDRARPVTVFQNARVAQEVDVVVEPDEALQRRQVQPEAHQRIVNRGDEGNEDADADAAAPAGSADRAEHAGRMRRLRTGTAPVV